MNLNVIETSIISKARREAAFRVGIGYESINKTLYNQLGSPEYIRFAIDPDERVVGIAKCNEQDEGRLKCFVQKSGQVTVGSTVVSRTIRKLTADKTKSYTFFIEGKEGDYFIAHIDKARTK